MYLLKKLCNELNKFVSYIIINNLKKRTKFVSSGGSDNINYKHHLNFMQYKRSYVLVF
jgi:hypothetical protein